MAKRSRLRSTNYNSLHRAAGDRIYMIDIDGVEIGTDGTPLCLIETKHINETFSEFQQSVLVRLGDMAGLPVYVVFHNAECTLFNVRPLNGAAVIQHGSDRIAFCNRLEYLIWLHRLRDSQPTAVEIEQFLAWYPESNE